MPQRLLDAYLSVVERLFSSTNYCGSSTNYHFSLTKYDYLSVVERLFSSTNYNFRSTTYHFSSTAYYLASPNYYYLSVVERQRHEPLGYPARERELVFDFLQPSITIKDSLLIRGQVQHRLRKGSRRHRNAFGS